ncbi:hypothetical protein N2152v2_007309 [Parachlorella kessleri]
MEALVALLGEVQAFKYDSGGFKNVVLTITGFYGGERELVKQLALHCRVRYEPSLVKGWTTHLVCNATTTVHRSEKLVRAAEWGIPAVNLQWFADSILEGGPLPVDEYAVQLPKPAVEGRAVPREPGTLQQNVVRWPHQPVRRPSSAASNEPTEAAAAAAAAPPPPAGRTERIQNSPAQDPVARPALCALENVMAQLQGVSISPKPQLTAAARKRPYDQREEVPEESSLVVIHAGSPNHSESLQHLVCVASPTTSPVSSRLEPRAEQRRRPSMEDVRPAVIARPAPAPTVQLGDSVALKLLKAAPRGNCVREHHGLSTLKGVQFAEQVQVAKAGLLLSSKEKRTAVRLQAKSVGGPVADDHQSSRLEVLGEPQTFYRLADGIWYLEYCQLYTAGQAEELAAEQGIHLALPAGFDRHNELLKSTARQFAALEDVLGGVTVRRVKQGGTMLKLKGAATGTPSYFWRTALDPTTLQCLTDRPAKDFVASEGLQL